MLFILLIYFTTLAVSRPYSYSINNITTNEYGAVGGMKINRGNRSTQRKPILAPFHPPQILDELIGQETSYHIWKLASINPTCEFP
jgi:hypothetical protein